MAAPDKENVAFIGLGIMGRRMAANLVANEVPLTVYNRSQEPREALGKQGAQVAASFREAVEDADVVFSMLSTPVVVADVAWGADGFLSAMKKDALWVDCTTVHPSFSLRSQTEAAARDVRFVDAPVAGTKPHAKAGELAFFVGAQAQDLDQIGFYLKMMGEKILHVGAVGKGTSLKMLVNGLLGQAMLAFSEAVLLGEKLGISRDFLLDALPGMAVAAPFTAAKAEKIQQGDYSVQFPLEWMHKDLQLAARTAYEENQPLYMVNLAKEVFASARKSGLDRADFSAIYRYLAGEDA